MAYKYFSDYTKRSSDMKVIEPKTLIPELIYLEMTSLPNKFKAFLIEFVNIYVRFLIYFLSA